MRAVPAGEEWLVVFGRDGGDGRSTTNWTSPALLAPGSTR